MKRGPLSGEEKEYILRNRNDHSVDNLSKKMDRSISIINKFIATCAPARNGQGSQAGKLMARNKERGVTVMTEAASMEGDKNRKKPTQPTRYNNIIHKIKED